MDDATDHDSCIQEVESLKAIFEDDLQIDETESGWPERLTIKILPATGDDRSKQYVCLTLMLRLPHAYPHEPPEISVKNPRGLSDEEISSMLEDMRASAAKKPGSPVLYEIIEIAKECLTEGNIPHCPCTICLEHFKEGDAFTKTDCYHYFHKACLWSYYQHAQRQAEEANIEAVAHQQEPQPFKPLCPTCRFELGEVDEEDLELAPPPVEDDEMVSAITPEVHQRQAEMAKIFQKQQKQGGIIDLEAERSKYLVSADTVVVLNHDPDPKFLPSSERKKNSVKETNPSKKQGDVGSSEKISADSQSKEEVKGSRPNRGHENKGTNDRGQETRGQDHRGQNYRRQGYRGHDNRGYNRRNWRTSGYSGQEYDYYGDQDYYHEMDGNSPRWQDDHSRPQSRQSNNRGWRQGRDKENYQASDQRAFEDRSSGQQQQKRYPRLKENDDTHPKDDKKNVRGRDQCKEENAPPGADHGSEERGELGEEGGRGGGRNQRNRRNRQRHRRNRQDGDYQQERPNSGGQTDSVAPENSNRDGNRNRPEKEQKKESRSSKDQEGGSSTTNDFTTSKPSEGSGKNAPRGDIDSFKEGKINQQGQRHHRRGDHRNRRVSDGGEGVDHHTDGDRDHERKPHPREFHRRKSSDAHDTASAQPKDRRDEGKSTKQEHHWRKEEGRGRQDPRHRQGEAQPQDSHSAEAKLHTGHRGTEKDGGQRYKQPQDGRGSDDYHHTHHRREYHGRGRGHYRHRGSRHHDDYHYEDEPEFRERQDERGSETHDHRGMESQRDHGLDGSAKRGRGYHRRDHGRKRGDSNRRPSDDKTTPRENYTPDRGTEKAEDKDRNGPKGHAEKSSGKGFLESSGHALGAPPGFSAVKFAEGGLHSPPGFTAASSAAPSSGVRPPPGFSGKSTVAPPPGFSKASSSSAD